MHNVNFSIVIIKYMIYRKSQTKYVNIIGTYRIQNKIVSKTMSKDFLFFCELLHDGPEYSNPVNNSQQTLRQQLGISLIQQLFISK